MKFMQNVPGKNRKSNHQFFITSPGQEKTCEKKAKSRFIFFAEFDFTPTFAAAIPETARSSRG